MTAAWAPEAERLRASRPLPASARAHARWRPLAFAALVAVAVRLLFLNQPLSKDESGFLVVAQQWHDGGTSLYGNYWVDRPPLLITLFQAAASLGGAVPLRLLGCLATAVVVLGCGHVAERLGGAQAARWAAITAAALCVSPLLGGLSVNGELLSAPFVVGGIAALIEVLVPRSDRRAALFAAAAGAGTVASLLVKQNMADVAVFAMIALLLAWRRREITRRRLTRALLGYAAGVLVCLVVAAAWTAAHGTSLRGVFDAMYPFRLEAARMIAEHSHQAASTRLWLLLLSWLASGGAVIMAVIGWATASSRLRGPIVWGLVGTVLFDIVSVALGGSYWNHYLIQLVVPLSVLCGYLVARGQPGARVAVASAAVAAAVALGVLAAGGHTTIGTSVGQAVGRVARKGDTIITVWGHADVTHASGLSSPYPYLWSLPARTLDPRLTTLSSVLAGPDAPTWFVAWGGIGSWARDPNRSTAARVLAARYHPVADLDGRIVLLRNGVDRPTPQLLPTPLATKEAP